MKRRARPKAERVIVRYAETYHAPGLKIKAFCLPTLPSASGFEVVEAYILKAGHLERDNQRFEFQDVRLYLLDQWQCADCLGWSKLSEPCHRCGKARTADAVDPADPSSVDPTPRVKSSSS